MYLICSGQNSMIKTYHDLVWATVTDEFPCDKPFTIREAVAKVTPQLSHLSPRTVEQIVRVCLHYTLDNVDPLDPALVRIGSKGWLLPRGD